MKKRILMILMVLVLASSFIFAESNVLFATVIPYDIQGVSSSWKTNHVSDYGWGVRLGYRRFVGPILAGVDLAYKGFIQPSTEYVLTNAQVLAKFGGKVVLSDNCDLNGEIGGGVELAMSRHVVNFLPVVAGSVSLSSYVNSNLAMVFGADFSITWPTTKGSSYSATVWESGLNIGLEYDF